MFKHNGYIGFFPHNKPSVVPTVNEIKKNPYIGLLRHDKKNLSNTNINSYYLDNDIDYIEYSDEEEYEGYDSCYEYYDSIVEKPKKKQKFECPKEFNTDTFINVAKKLI